jgi:hypothetical protein
MEPYIECSKPDLRAIRPDSPDIDALDHSGQQNKYAKKPDTRQQISFFLHVFLVLSYLYCLSAI